MKYIKKEKKMKKQNKKIACNILNIYSDKKISEIQCKLFI